VNGAVHEVAMLFALVLRDPIQPQFTVKESQRTGSGPRKLRLCSPA
jgi:hypothetical protein